MISSKHGHFRNKREGNIIISDYSGAFNVTGIRAIFDDVIAIASGIEHWCWFQRPAQDAGISPKAIEEMIRRYQTLHHYGCCAIGVIYTNVLINAVTLPKDNSIKIPFKVAKNETELFTLFQQTMAEKSSASTARLTNTKTLAKARYSNIVEDFVSASEAIGCSESTIQALTGHSRRELEMLAGDITTEQYTILQGFSALVSLISFKLNDDAQAIKHWFVTEQTEFGGCPQHICQRPEGLHHLLRKVTER